MRGIDRTLTDSSVKKYIFNCNDGKKAKGPLDGKRSLSPTDVCNTNTNK